MKAIMKFIPDLRDYKPLLYLYSVLCNLAGIGMIRVLTAFEDFTLKDLLHDKTIVVCLLLLAVDLPVLLFFKCSAEKLKYKFSNIIIQYMIFIVIKAVLLVLYIIYMHELTIVTLIVLMISYGIWIFLGIELVIILIVIIIYIYNIIRII